MLMRAKAVTAPTRSAVIALTVAAYFFFAAQTLLIYEIERWTIRAIFSP
jgi:hypothetical protein